VEGTKKSFILSFFILFIAFIIIVDVQEPTNNTQRSSNGDWQHKKWQSQNQQVLIQITFSTYSNQVALQKVIKLSLDVTWWELKWNGSNPKARSPQINDLA